MIRESTYYFPNIFHSGAETRFPHRLGRRRPILCRPGIGGSGWLPALGTRGFQRPLSDPSTDLQYVATVQSVTDETCQLRTPRRIRSAKQRGGFGRVSRSQHQCVELSVIDQFPIRRGSRELRPLDPRGKEMKTQGVSVRPTRKPKLLSRKSVAILPRSAERRLSGSKSQEPPRTTRRLQSPAVHAEPFVGAPL